MRTNTFGAVTRIRSAITIATYEYFGNNRQMTYVELPLMTTNCCEGGANPMQCTTLLSTNKVSDIHVITKYEDDAKSKPTKTDHIDYDKDFFNKPVYLTVSNQLHLEAFAQGLKEVFTLTRCVRAEPSDDRTHIAEISMLEYEICFTDIDDNIKTATDYIKYCISYCLKYCKKDLEFLHQYVYSKTQNTSDKNFQPKKQTLIEQLESYVSKSIVKITHEDTITILLEHQKEGKIKFNNQPTYDGDLSNEHERYITDILYPGCMIAVQRYPTAVKAFYMPDCGDGKHVECFDLLVRGMELVGGSQRIWNYEELEKKMKSLGMDLKELQWYLDLRKYGSVPHGGAGVGVDRLVMLITGMENIRDVVSFIRTVHNCEY
jgi:asparaginyl-tRNA synthetase